MKYKHYVENIINDQASNISEPKYFMIFHRVRGFTKANSSGIVEDLLQIQVAKMNYAFFMP